MADFDGVVGIVHGNPDQALLPMARAVPRCPCGEAFQAVGVTI